MGTVDDPPGSQQNESLGVPQSVSGVRFGDDSPGVKAVGGSSAHTELRELGDWHSSHDGEGKSQIGRRACQNEEFLKTP